MAKAKQLWNTSGVLKSYTDAEGLYQVVRPWDEVHGGGDIEILEDDVDRLMKNGFTDQDPNPAPAPEPKKKKAAAAAAATAAEAPAEEGG